MKQQAYPEPDGMKKKKSMDQGQAPSRGIMTNAFYLQYVIRQKWLGDYFLLTNTESAYVTQFL